MQQTTDGGYIIGGYTNSYGAGGCDLYLVKANSQGDTLWTRTYGTRYDDESHSVLQTTDSGYIMAGSTDSGLFSENAYLIKTDAQGDTLWTRTYGGENYARFYSVQQTADGGFIMIGAARSPPHVPRASPGVPPAPHALGPLRPRGRPVLQPTQAVQEIHPGGQGGQGRQPAVADADRGGGMELRQVDPRYCAVSTRTYLSTLSTV